MMKPKGWRKEPTRHALASKGIKTKANPIERRMDKEFKHNIHSYRDFRINTFKNRYDACKNIQCEQDLRIQYRLVESGRYALMEEQAHNFLVSLDPDEISLIKKDAPILISLANEYATIEELRKIN